MSALDRETARWPPPTVSTGPHRLPHAEDVSFSLTARLVNACGIDARNPWRRARTPRCARGASLLPSANQRREQALEREVQPVRSVHCGQTAVRRPHRPQR